MRKFVIAGLVWFAAASCGGGTTEPAAIDLVTVSGDTTVVIAGTTALTAAASAGGVPAAAGVTFLWSSSDTATASVNWRANASASGNLMGRRLASLSQSACVRFSQVFRCT